MTTSRHATWLALAFAVGCARTPAQAPAPPPAGEASAVPAELRAQIERSQRLGRALYIQDKAAAIASDVLFEHVASPQERGVRGYLTIREAGAEPAFLTFFYTNEDPPRIAFRIRVPMASHVKPSFEALDPPAPTTAGLRTLIRARHTALAALPADHRQPVNPVLLPGDGGRVLIYLLAGTKRANVAVFGKHYRAQVSPDGSELVSFEPLSNSALEVPLPAPAADPGHRPVGLVVSQVVTDYPLETHVFVSLQHKMPVYVATARGNWRVDGEAITLLPPR
jgi:hypothetical protein